MSITDELREWVNGAKPAVVDGCSISVGTMTYGCKKALLAIADRIDAEHQKAIRELNNLAEACELLPVDADGERIRVGDVMEWPTTGETFEVVGIGDGTLFYIEDGNELADWTGASTKRHYHAPTVEDVLRDFGVDIAHALDADPDATVPEAIIAEYAARLRLREDA